MKRFLEKLTRVASPFIVGICIERDMLASKAVEEPILYRNSPVGRGGEHNVSP